MEHEIAFWGASMREEKSSLALYIAWFSNSLINVEQNQYETKYDLIRKKTRQ